MNKKTISVLSGAVSLVMGLSCLSFCNLSNTDIFTAVPAVSVSAAETMRNISSAELVKDMGLGWNLGNTFDSVCPWIVNGAVEEYEKGWGNPVVTKDVIKKVKATGFKTVRLPVTWINCMDTSTNKVRDDFMKRIQEVVDWCMEEDLYVIINVHHDGGVADTSWIRNISKDYAGVEKRFEALWTQIANNFKDYSDYLIFEGMNEVEFKDLSKTDAYNTMNKLNQKFVDTVRATGGNNANRHLLISGYNTDIAQTCDSRFVMPEDSAGKLMLSLHYYSPPQFCVAESNCTWCTPQTTWGTSDDMAALDADMMKIYKNFISKGVPVIIGEYGVLTEAANNKDKTSIRNYLSAVSEKALSYGMCPVLWDAGSSGDMLFLDRKSVAWNDTTIEKNYQELAEKYKNGQISTQTPEIKTYDEKTVSIGSDGWVTVGADKSRLCGVRFNISCSSSWDSQGGGGINFADDWDNCTEFGFNSVYDTVEVIFTDAQRAKIADKIGVFFWWTLLDNPNDEGSGHKDELSFRDGKITLLFESSGQPAVTTTTQKPVETTVTTTTTKAPETTVTTTQKPDDTTVTTTVTEAPSVAVKGDVDGNGNLTAADLAKLMQALVGKVTLTENQTKSADMDNDGNISVLDLIMLKNLLISD
ncbi:MAG: cellulase family glycosylhydrolase [Oscillospiraceae bacterium]|nr:cellulase family glycosylhydrolase [Oscillospiraceae bacterium]